MAPSLGRPVLFDTLEQGDRILIAGCGGGFDVFCGLPIYLWLRKLGKTPLLANLSFSRLETVAGANLADGFVRVDAASDNRTAYFPEQKLAAWLATRGVTESVYCFPKTGVAQLRDAYETLVTAHDIDTILLVDGGTDSLMRGDESGLGTPHEDMLSIVAVHQTSVARKLLACLGFGIDAYHGVCHAHFLEAVAALARDGHYLGAFSLVGEQDEARAYIEAVDYANRNMPEHPSIVNASIASALEGAMGDVHRTHRTQGSRLWINPLMTLYWAFRLEGIADRLLLRELLESTTSFAQVVLRIEAFRRSVIPRAAYAIPH